MKPSRLAGFLGLERNLVLLSLAVVAIGIGEELWMRFLPKYLEVLGAGVLAIGLFDALKTLLGALYAWPGGAAVDRWGHRWSLLLFTALSIAGYALVCAIPFWPAVILASFLFLAWSNLSLPATFTLVGANLPPGKHSMGIGLQSLIKRVPILIGPVLGGILIDRMGVARGVRVGALASVAAGILALALLSLVRGGAVSRTAMPGLSNTLRSFSPRLRRLLLSDILIRFCERLPFAWVVIYAMDGAGMSGEQVGILIAIEVIAAMLCYIPAAWFADRYGREPFVIATFLFFTAFPVVLYYSHTFAMLAVAFAVRGLKEFGEPARKALIIGYSHEKTRGRTVGAYYLVRDTVVTSGSFLGAALWKLGPGFNFWTAAGLGATGAAVYILTVRGKQ
ncbi:MAG: MFS transporter [Acidobacteriota bacterium]|nr:MFS transporter [Acidobacteriota bacterium]